MKIFRRHFLSKALSLITGLVFLNMSFFLAEVTYLKFDKKEIMENIAKLILNSGFEEERDCEPVGGEGSIKGIDLILQQVQIHHTSSFLMSLHTNRTVVDHYRHANHSFTFYTPPDFSFFS